MPRKFEGTGVHPVEIKHFRDDIFVDDLFRDLFSNCLELGKPRLCFRITKFKPVDWITLFVLKYAMYNYGRNSFVIYKNMIGMNVPPVQIMHQLVASLIISQPGYRVTVPS